MVSRDLLKGSLNILLLSLLQIRPMYGYQIAKEVHARSEGVLRLKEGSLYPALHRLEHAGLIEGFWQRREDGVDRRYYRLTATGERVAEEKQAEWQRFVSAIEGVIRHA